MTDTLAPIIEMMFAFDENSHNNKGRCHRHTDVEIQHTDVEIHHTDVNTLMSEPTVTAGKKKKAVVAGGASTTSSQADKHDVKVREISEGNYNLHTNFKSKSVINSINYITNTTGLGGVCGGFARVGMRVVR